MKLLLITIAASGSVLPATGASAKDQLPPNVTTRPYGAGKNQVIDAIDYSFSASKPVEFSRIKMCIASNLTNDEVQLRDSAGSFVGNSGTYYRTENKQTVQGGGIFKYVDDSSKSLVARGSVSRQGGLGGIISLAIRFDLEVSAEANAVKMRMLHIEAAMKNTGSASNDGFKPVGVWAGSMYKKNILALNGVADQLKSCFRS
jgi:hypothetical protein